MNNNSDSLPSGYDRITAFYDAFACIFSLNRINTSQVAFISHLTTQKRALIIGGGTGYFLQKLLIQNKEIQIVYVEVSENMIEYAKKRILQNCPNGINRVTFICKGIEDFEWQAYDLIVCNYILDLFENTFVEDLAEKFKNNLTKKGILYVTDFRISESSSLMKWCTKLGLAILYQFFRWATQLKTNTLPDTENILLKKGFRVSNSKLFLKGILMCRLYKL
jgi:ubiquinone/menaquinone biosynthesis C-methylase UbiE